MAQDRKVQHRYEEAMKESSGRRYDDAINHEIDDGRLRADQHTGQYGVLPPNTEALEAPEVKAAVDLVPDMTREDWKRVHLLRPGNRLQTGDKYLDLRDLRRGELVATGEETVSSSSLFVHKNDVDYEIWNRLLGRGDRNFTG